MKTYLFTIASIMFLLTIRTFSLCQEAICYSKIANNNKFLILVLIILFL